MVPDPLRAAMTTLLPDADTDIPNQYVSSDIISGKALDPNSAVGIAVVAQPDEDPGIPTTMISL